MNCSVAFILIWDFWSVVRYVLHKSRLSFIHMIWRNHLFIRVVKSRSSSVRPITSKINSVVQVLSLVQTYVILEILLKTIVHSTNWTSTIGKFISVVFTLRLIKWIGMTISCWLSSSADCCMISWSLRAFMMHIEAHACHVHHIWIMSSVLKSIFRIIYRHIVIKLHGVTRTSVLSLFSKFRLGDCFWYVLTVSIDVRWSSVSLLSHNAWTILSWVELLSGHHHLLISIRRLSLIDKIKIDILAISIGYRSSNPTTISKTVSISIWLHNLIYIILLSIGIKLVMPCITSFHMIHEIPICHCVSHLNLIILRKLTTIACCLKTSHFSLIKCRLFTLNIRKHVMNSRIVSRLKHNSVMSCVHFIDA